MNQKKQQDWFSRLGGYLAIPHELLHVIGFRLVGKRCKYQWGNSYVSPIEPMLPWQRLVGRLFPFVTFSSLFILFTILSGFAYGQALKNGSFLGFIILTIIAYIFGLYAGSTISDLRRAYLLITNKPWYSWTPFDFMYWPIVDWDKIREQEKEKEKEKQGEINDKPS